MYACIPPVCFVPVEAGGGHQSPRTGVTGGCKPTRECLEPSSSPRAAIAFNPEPSLQPQQCEF